MTNQLRAALETVAALETEPGIITTGKPLVKAIAAARAALADAAPHPFAGQPLTPRAALDSIMWHTNGECMPADESRRLTYYSRTLLNVRNTARAALQADDKNPTPTGRSMRQALNAALDLLTDPDAEPEQADAVTEQIRAALAATTTTAPEPQTIRYEIADLTEDQRDLIANGLRIAHDRYAEDIKELGNSTQHVRLAEQFERQRVETSKLIDRIEP